MALNDLIRNCVIAAGLALASTHAGCEEGAYEEKECLSNCFFYGCEEGECLEIPKKATENPEQTKLKQIPADNLLLQEESKGVKFYYTAPQEYAEFAKKDLDWFKKCYFEVKDFLGIEPLYNHFLIEIEETSSIPPGSAGNYFIRVRYDNLSEYYQFHDYESNIPCKYNDIQLFGISPGIYVDVHEMAHYFVGQRTTGFFDEGIANYAMVQLSESDPNQHWESIYPYHTSGSFWKYVEETYGSDKVKETLTEISRINPQYSKDIFITEGVMLKQVIKNVVGTDLSSYAVETFQDYCYGSSNEYCPFIEGEEKLEQEYQTYLNEIE